MPVTRYRPILLVFVLALVLVPAAVFAQEFPGQLVPCSGGSDDPCDFCDLATLLQNILNFAIVFAVVTSAVLFAAAGFIFLTNTGNSDRASKAKKIFGSVAIGLVLILGAWLIVDTIMKTLSGGEFGPWNDVCSPTSASSSVGGQDINTTFGNF